MAVTTPEAMKSYIWLQCAGGSVQQVEEEVAMFCPVIYRQILNSGMGSSKNNAISLPEQVYPSVLSMVLDYCRFHQVPGRSNKERKSFDEKFIKLETNKLCELASAAHSLQLKALVSLTSRALARIIEGKTTEEIRETFHLPDDLTEEEKLEPMKNTTDDPRIRLLNRLHAKKRNELMERQKSKIVEVGELKDEKVVDRSVDDLMSFINGDEDSKCAKASKNKRKNRRKKCSSEPSKNNSTVPKQVGICSPTPSLGSEIKERNEDTFASRVQLEDADIDDELDPALKEELDREVEDFARRLEVDWPERMQEILSLGQEKRVVPNLIHGNCPIGIYTGLDS